MMFAAVIPGDPKGQGSLTLWRSPDGTERAKHPPATVLHRNNAIATLRSEWGGRDPLTGPVQVGLEFMFTRPKSHYGTGRNANRVKDSAPSRQTSYPDIDKAVRLVCDALVIAGVLRDDSQVAQVSAQKRYGARGMTVVEVMEL